MNNGDTIDAKLLDLMLRAGSRWVLWLLLFLSLAAITIIVERIWFFIQERAPRQRLKEVIAALPTKGPKDALAKLSNALSMEAAVARAVLAAADDGAGVAEERKAAVLEAERLRYEKRLAFLGTLGNNAPFIGLFGTVLGIIRAFHDLAGNTLAGTQVVMSGIAEALVATGIGLLVALPAVATYNTFIRRVETAVANSEAIAHDILAYIKSQKKDAA